MIGQEFEVVLVELESRRKLCMDLMNGVQELQENGCERPILIGVEQIRPVIKPVSESEPFFLDENPEAFDGSIVWIETKLCKTGDLRGNVPAIFKAEHDRSTLTVEKIDDSSR